MGTSESLEVAAQLQSVVDKLLFNVKEARVLEAGCGSLSRLQLPEGAHVVGIDISELQLARNTELHERVLGDIQSYQLPGCSFDLIVCWWVLEHLAEPRRALANFVQALQDGGVIILVLPNSHSIKGLVTKLTPHWVHVWAYRYIFKVKDAGKADTAPFRTYHRFAVAPSALKTFAHDHNLTVEYFRLFEAGWQRNLRVRLGLTNARWSVFKWLTSAATLGRISAEHTECAIILRKPQR